MFSEGVLHLCSRVSPHVPRLALQERVDRIVEQPTQVLDIKGVKPLKAVEMLRETLQGDPQKQEEWRAKARVASILGSCPRSKASFRSGIKHWIQFIEATRGAENMNRYAFPPLLDDVLAWANTFACLGAYRLGTWGAGGSMCSVQAHGEITSAIYAAHVTPWA